MPLPFSGLPQGIAISRTGNLSLRTGKISGKTIFPGLFDRFS
jgi:hypothetical protein